MWYYFHVVNEKCQWNYEYCKTWPGYLRPYQKETDEMYPLITRDPVSGGEMIVTRLECPESGIVIEGRFSLGWIGRLCRRRHAPAERLGPWQHLKMSEIEF